MAQHQPYRKGARQPGAALSAMLIGAPAVMSNPADLQRSVRQGAAEATSGWRDRGSYRVSSEQRLNKVEGSRRRGRGFYDVVGDNGMRGHMYNLDDPGSIVWLVDEITRGSRPQGGAPGSARRDLERQAAPARTSAVAGVADESSDPVSALVDALVWRVKGGGGIGGPLRKPTRAPWTPGSHRDPRSPARVSSPYSPTRA